MRILALDLGSTIGVALSSKMKGYSKKFEGHRVARANAFHDWLETFIAEQYPRTAPPLDVIIYERPIVRGRDATRCLWGLAGIVEAVGHSWGAAVLDAELKTVKKHVTGRGDASKQDVIDAMRAKGWDVWNEHEADAAAVCQYAMDKAEVADA